MNVRQKPVPAPNIQSMFNVPKRGNFGYWCRIFILGFLLPMLLIGIPVTIILFNWHEKLTLLGPLCGFIFGSYNVVKYHKKLWSMSEKEYSKIAKLNAPDRGGVAYWLYIIVFAFLIPAIIISLGAIFLIHVIVPKLAFLGLIIGPCMAFIISRKVHHSVIHLPDAEYEKCFRYDSENLCKDSGDPYDPASFAWWTFGPGSSTYRDKIN